MNRKIIFFLLIFVSICAISHVSAAEISDNATDDVVASDDMNLNEDSDLKLSDDAPDVLATNETVGDVSNDSSQESVVKSTAKIKASKLTVAYKKSTKWSLKLVDSNNKPLANKNILLKIYTGKKYKTVTVKTDSKGVASYNTKKLSAGKHKIVASFSDANYNCKHVKSSVKVIKQKALKILAKSDAMKDGSVVYIFVLNKKTKKFMNGVKLKLKIYTGKKYKTVVLKTKKFKGNKGLGIYATNALKVGKHKIKITPVSIKYKGSKKVTMKIKKSAKKYTKWETVL